MYKKFLRMILSIVLKLLRENPYRSERARGNNGRYIKEDRLMKDRLVQSIAKEKGWHAALPEWHAVNSGRTIH